MNKKEQLEQYLEDEPKARERSNKYRTITNMIMKWYPSVKVTKLMMDEMVKGDRAMFAATGVTNGEILKGVRFTSKGAVTHSIVMRSFTGTVRFIEAVHDFKRKPGYSDN